MKILVFDIGGTAIKYGICKDGELTYTNEIPTESHNGGLHILSTVKKVCVQTIEEDKKNNPDEPFDGIGVSTAGQVNFETGNITFANSNIPDYKDINYRKELESLCGLPVMVENDVNSAAIGEAIFGNGKDFDSFLCLTYGTGIGGAIVINNQIYHGDNFSAGEFGSIVTHADIRLAGSDYFDGCYERYASTTALVNKASEYNPNLENGREIFKHMDDPNVVNIINTWIDEICIGLITLIHIFNPSCIILGGGIMNQPYIINTLKEKIYPLIMPTFANVNITNASLGNNAGMLGIYHLTYEYCNKTKNPR